MTTERPDRRAVRGLHVIDGGRRSTGTETSAFGTPGVRVNHDSSKFYERFDFEAPSLSAEDALLQVYSGPDEVRVGDAADTGLLSGSVGLVVTSPPYFVGKEYEDGDGCPQSWPDYLDWLRDVLAECYRILEPGGRIAVNVAGLGRRPYISLPSKATQIMEDLGFLLRGEIVWVKADGSSSMAAGTWRSPHNPCLRDVSERVIVASKGTYHRMGTQAERRKAGLPSEYLIEKDWWAKDTLDVWRIRPQTSSVSHPAPFPVELPLRLIRMHTFVGDLVVDPMCGSGSTLLAARQLGRRFVGIDRDERYVGVARRRLETVTPDMVISALIPPVTPDLESLLATGEGDVEDPGLQHSGVQDNRAEDSLSVGTQLSFGGWGEEG